MLDHPEIKRLARVADWLARCGWAEANAGNMSVRVSFEQVPTLYAPCEEYPLRHPFPTLNGTHYLVTATKCRARDVLQAPEAAIGFFEVIRNGAAVSCRWGAGPPTSEFPAHLSIHAMCLESRPEMRAILHTHPPHLIAMSHLEDFRDGDPLNKALRMMHPEVGIRVPGGISSMPYRIPGSMELGQVTRDALVDRNLALWPMHGVVSLAPDLEQALDQIEIVEKAAQLYLLALSTGRKPTGLSDEQIRASREYWGIRDDAG